MTSRALPLVLDEPGPDCAAPAVDRICFALGCASNVTTRLARGQHHPTRCGRDNIAPGFAAGAGDRRDCARFDGCVELHELVVRADPKHREPPVHCPTDCPGFIEPGRRKG
jgi:hypothetical protein